MNQLDVNNFITYNSDDSAYVLNETLLNISLENRSLGSIFNIPMPPPKASLPLPTVDEWRAINQRIWELSTTLGNKIPVLFGLDSVHGANYVFNATIFPQQIGMAASFNTQLVVQAGFITAQETRYAGIPWVFSPILGLAVQPVWSRVYETFGEDPFLVSQMGAAIITGLQYPASNEMNEPNWKHTVAACAKHFIGYSNVRSGRDRTPVWTPMNILQQYFLPPFETALSSPVNALSVMETYIELNGRPVVSSQMILQFLLRQQLDYPGMLVTDYNEIFNLASFHKASANFTEALYDSINATSIDMAMVGTDLQHKFPNVVNTLLAQMKQGRLDETRLRTSSGRVLVLKQQLGLITSINPETNPATGEETIPLGKSPVPNNTTGCVFACDANRKAAFDLAQQSITLLQNNESYLPIINNFNAGGKLDKSSNIAVVGLGCDSVPLMSGGWTVAWQGTDDAASIPYGSTILEALRAQLTNSTITYSPGCNVTEGSNCDEEAMNSAIENARNAKTVVLCLGERHYAEQPGDIDNMTMPGEQLSLARRIADVNSNIVVVLVQGRPRLLEDIPIRVQSIINAYLPGPMGGLAISNVICGLFNPVGRLPITYPSRPNNGPIQHFRKYSANTFNDYDIQWNFGHGISYAIFQVAEFDMQQEGTNYVFNIRIRNLHPIVSGGSRVLLYATQEYRPITPEVERLVGFAAVDVLQPGEFRIITITVPQRSFSFVDEYNCEHITSAPIFVNINGDTSNSIMISPQEVNYFAACSSWGYQFQAHSGHPSIIVPTVNNHPHSSTSAYFISSVVCFGAGIVGTVILITWMRKRGNSQAGQLLAPTSV